MRWIVLMLLASVLCSCDVEAGTDGYLEPDIEQGPDVEYAVDASEPDVNAEDIHVCGERGEFECVGPDELRQCYNGGDWIYLVCSGMCSDLGKASLGCGPDLNGVDHCLCAE